MFESGFLASRIGTSLSSEVIFSRSDTILLGGCNRSGRLILISRDQSLLARLRSICDGTEELPRSDRYLRHATNCIRLKNFARRLSNVLVNVGIVGRGMDWFAESLVMTGIFHFLLVRKASTCDEHVYQYLLLILERNFVITSWRGTSLL